MSAYQHDDGTEMVEYKPGRTIRRDVGIRLGLIVPVVGLGPGRPVTFAPAVDPQPEPDASSIQPSHEDLVSIAAAPADVARRLLVDDDMARRAWVLVATDVTGPRQASAAAPTRTPKPRPEKRSVSAILAEAARNQRARKVRA